MITVTVMTVIFLIFMGLQATHGLVENQLCLIRPNTPMCHDQYGEYYPSLDYKLPLFPHNPGEDQDWTGI